MDDHVVSLLINTILYDVILTLLIVLLVLLIIICIKQHFVLKRYISGQETINALIDMNTQSFTTINNLYDVICRIMKNKVNEISPCSGGDDKTEVEPLEEIKLP